MAAATPAAPPLRQFLGNGRPLLFHRPAGCADGRFICPFVRVETPGPFGQLVPLFRGCGTPRNSLQQFLIATAQPHRPFCAQHPPQQRLVVHLHGGHWRRPTAVGPRRAAGFSWTLARLNSWRRLLFAQQVRPVEGQVGMRVLERFDDLRIQRAAANAHIWRRAEHIQDARPLRTGARPINVHHHRALVATLVLGVPNERHDPLTSSISSSRPSCAARLWLPVERRASPPIERRLSSQFSGL